MDVVDPGRKALTSAQPAPDSQDNLAQERAGRLPVNGGATIGRSAHEYAKRALSGP